VEVAGGGYLNAFFDRATFFSSLIVELLAAPLKPTVNFAKNSRRVFSMSPPAKDSTLH